MVKLLNPIIISSSMAAAAAGNLRHPKSRDLGFIFDTEQDNFKETRIIGGEEDTDRRFGYAVSLEDDFGQFCGGTLVRSDIVVSAAHCGGGEIWARVGAHDITADEGTRIKVKKQIIHDNYDPEITDFDFMILVLEEPAPADVPVANLPQSDNLSDNDSLTVMGWGNTKATGFKPSDVLKGVEVKYIPNDECNGKYDGEISGQMLCAGEDAGGEDACQGDSGGPLVRLGANSDGSADELVGIVSWGYGCAEAQYPGVYSRVFEQIAWFESTIDQESSSSVSSNASTPPNPPTPTPPSPTPPTPTPPTPTPPTEGSNFRTVLSEDFNSAFGFNSMNKGGVHVRYYETARGKNGVARIQSGIGDKSAFWTNQLSTQRSLRTSSQWRITHIYYGNSMEIDQDKFCLQYQEDGQDWTDAKCYISGQDFTNGVWNEDSVVIDVSSTANTVAFKWICQGDDRGLPQPNI